MRKLLHFWQFSLAGYDDILGVIGPFGFWQKRSTVFLWFIIAFIGFPFLIYTFALAKPGKIYFRIFRNNTRRVNFITISLISLNRIPVSRAGM